MWQPTETAPKNELIGLRRKQNMYFGRYAYSANNKYYFTIQGGTNIQPKPCDYWQPIPDSYIEDPYPPQNDPLQIRIRATVWKKLWVTTPRIYILNPDTHPLVTIRVRTDNPPGLKVVDGIVPIENEENCRIVYFEDNAVYNLITSLDFPCLTVTPQIHLNDRRSQQLSCYFPEK